MTDWTYKEARDRSLRALLSAPAKRHDLGIDWSYVAAVEWRRFETEEEMRLAAIAFHAVLMQMTKAVYAVAEALTEALQPVFEAILEIGRTFATALGIEPTDEEAELASVPPPWRSKQQPLTPRTISGPFRALSVRSTPRHRARDCC